MTRLACLLKSSTQLTQFHLQSGKTVHFEHAVYVYVISRGGNFRAFCGSEQDHKNFTHENFHNAYTQYGSFLTSKLLGFGQFMKTYPSKAFLVYIGFEETDLLVLLSAQHNLHHFVCCRCELVRLGEGKTVHFNNLRIIRRTTSGRSAHIRTCACMQCDDHYQVLVCRHHKTIIYRNPELISLISSLAYHHHHHHHCTASQVHLPLPVTACLYTVPLYMYT